MLWSGLCRPAGQLRLRPDQPLQPLIYIQFFVTLGFGIIMGVSVNMIGHAFKVRNPFFMTLIAMVIGCLGLYFAWVWYIVMVMDGTGMF